MLNCNNSVKKIMFKSSQNGFLISFSLYIQASVPSGLSNYDDTLPYENDDKQLWDPTRLSEEVAKEYLCKSLETQGAGGALGVNGIPNGSHVRDDEQVLD